MHVLYLSIKRETNNCNECRKNIRDISATKNTTQNSRQSVLWQQLCDVCCHLKLSERKHDYLPIFFRINRNQPIGHFCYLINLESACLFASECVKISILNVHMWEIVWEFSSFSEIWWAFSNYLSHVKILRFSIKTVPSVVKKGMYI
jgi:hypothetical protein